MDTGTTKACPFCAETIQAAATLCRFCGRNVAHTIAVPAAPAPPPATKKRISPAAFAGIVFGLIVLSCVLLRVTGLGLTLLQAIPGPRVEGWEGHIVADGQTLAARDVPTFDQLGKVSPSEIGKLIDADRAFLIDSGTRVRVLDVQVPRTLVHILDGAHTGENAWVLTTFVDK